MHRALVVLLVLACAACTKTEEDRVTAVVDDLASALDKHDNAQAATLFAGGVIPAVNSSGDSSTIYRLLNIPGSSDITIDNVKAVVIDDRAQARFAILGKVVRDSKVVGEMNLHLRLELEKSKNGSWLIIPGGELRE